MDYDLGAANVAMEGDIERAQAYVPRAKQVLRNLLVRMKIGGLEVGMDHWVLADDAYCYAIVAGSVRKAVIVVGDVRSTDGVIEHGIAVQTPDFVSGVAIGGTIQVGQDNQKRMSTFWPTALTETLHDLHGQAPNARLAVEPFSAFSQELGFNGDAPVKYSQYVKLKPTMYSGMMRKVVQFLMGFGKQLSRSIYDTAPPKIKAGVVAAPSKYEKDVRANGVQIRFDWRWFRTHGIVEAADGRLWLVEIGSTRGVIARPLPEHAVTRDPKFREKLEGLGDQAGLDALDLFGAWPTGEAFPGAAIESWIRAGVVVRLASQDDMQPFYSKSQYSSAMGWAFNEQGSEAHNTCNDIQNELQYSSHYAISLSVGSIVEVEPPNGAASLKNRFADLAQAEGFKDRFPAVMAKIDRLSQSQCNSYRFQTGPIDWLFDDLDALVLAPVAIGSANLSLVSRSPIYYPGTHQKMIKFPHPELGYLVSHDMRLAGPGGEPPGRCNATMHVFFAGNELKYVKYHRDIRPRPTVENTDDFEDCMYVGSWSSHEESSARVIPDMMYTSDFDDREEIPNSQTRDTRIHGRDMGYVRVYFSDNPFNLTQAFMNREKAFLREVNIVVVNGHFLSAVVTVPFNDRCAYYYSSVKGFSSRSTINVSSYVSLLDPWYCESWRNFGGWTSGHAVHPDDCCVCVARTVRSPAPRYAPSACADFADSGQWCFTCDNIETMTYSITLPPPVVAPGTSEGSTGHRVTHLVNATEHSPLLIEEVDKTGLNYERYWFIPSPDPDSGLTQYLDVTHNAMGIGDAMRYYKEPNEGPILKIGGPFPPSLGDQNITFIGVVP